MRMTTEVMVVKKKGPGHSLESTMARMTVKMNTSVMMHRLQMIRRAREPLMETHGRGVNRPALLLRAPSGTHL